MLWFTWRDGQWCRYRSPWQWYLLCVALGSCAVVALWFCRSYVGSVTFAVISHFSQPSADVKLGTVPESLSMFDGDETESCGRFSGLVETVVVELGGFLHSHSVGWACSGTADLVHATC